MNHNNRKPAGPAGGALAGHYADPGIGLPLSAGFFLCDDFIRGPGETVTGKVGDLLWSTTALSSGPGGSGASLQNVASATDSEFGILRASGATTANDGVVVHLGSAAAPLWRVPPPGFIMAVKLKLSSTSTDVQAWSGLANTTGGVQNADNNYFIGFKSYMGEWWGTCKNGASGNEQSQNLHVSTTSWRTIGFENVGSVTTPAIQFFVINLLSKDMNVWDRTDVGDPITSNVPNATLFPVAFGMKQTGTTSRNIQIDSFQLGGRTIR